MDLLKKIAGDDKSLDGEKARIYCKYAMPEEEVKKEFAKVEKLVQ